MDLNLQPKRFAKARFIHSQKETNDAADASVDTGVNKLKRKILDL